MKRATFPKRDGQNPHLCSLSTNSRSGCEQSNDSLGPQKSHTKQSNHKLECLFLQKVLVVTPPSDMLFCFNQCPKKIIWKKYESQLTRNIMPWQNPKAQKPSLVFLGSSRRSAPASLLSFVAKLSFHPMIHRNWPMLRPAHRSVRQESPRFFSGILRFVVIPNPVVIRESS